MCKEPQAQKPAPQSKTKIGRLIVKSKRRGSSSGAEEEEEEEETGQKVESEPTSGLEKGPSSKFPSESESSEDTELARRARRKESTKNRPKSMQTKGGYVFGKAQGERGQSTGPGHFAKHNKKVKTKNVNEYLAKASAFMANDIDTSEYVLLDNTILKFDAKSGYVGIVNGKQLRTFYEHDPKISSVPLAFAIIYTLDLAKTPIDQLSDKTRIYLNSLGMDFEKARKEVDAYKEDSRKKNEANNNGAVKTRKEFKERTESLKDEYPLSV
jgi:hypothetical protein